MKRADLIRHIESHGCLFVREGAKHTVYRNPATGISTTIPRHREIKKELARKICDDLGIPRCAVRGSRGNFEFQKREAAALQSMTRMR